MLHAFIGFDPRESRVYSVSEHSLIRRSSEPVRVYPIMESGCRQANIYWRGYTVDNTGQRTDDIDGRPFSTEFSFTRFLVPEIARRKHLKGLVLYADPDMLWLDDIAALFLYGPPAAKASGEKAVWVVPHQYHPTNTVKMEGQTQTTYSRKLWSSLMLFNLDHPTVQALTPEVVSTESGSYLHSLKWCDDADIGYLDERWNWIPGHSPSLPILDTFGSDDVGCLHFTEGTPDMKFRSESVYDSWWYKEIEHMDAANPSALDRYRSLSL